MGPTEPLTLRGIAARVVFVPLGVASHFARGVVARARLGTLHQRPTVFRCVAERPRARPAGPAGGRLRVYAVITHVVPPVDRLPAEAAAQYLARFQSCLDGLFRAFAHCDLTVEVNTYAGRHLLDRLPAYAAARVRACEHATGDPTRLEFHGHEMIAAAADRHDWFLFLEDDVVLHDPCFLEKLDLFNRAAADPSLVLMPHLYEMSQGRKVYVQRAARDGRVNPYSAHTAIHAPGVTFVEFENPHAAMFCLSQAQVRRWAASGRRWRGRTVWVGHNESACTGCLFECFRLYKPHPRHAHFLEAQHWGEKYATIYQGWDAAAGRPHDTLRPGTTDGAPVAPLRLVLGDGNAAR